MITKIVKTIFGSVADKVLAYFNKKQDIDLEKYKADASVLSEAMRADVELAKVRQLQAINDGSNWMTRWIRPGFAISPIIYYFAVMLDSVWFHTNSVQAVPVEVHEVFMVIVGFYFGGRVVEKIADKYISSKR